MIQFSESFKKFLEENKERSKVANSLYQYVRKPYIKAYKLMIQEELNYITFRNNGMISYMPKGKEQLFNEDGTWEKEGRQEGKPAKVIRKLFTDKAVKLFKESDLDCFNNIYKSHFNTELSFDLLDRNSIKEVYCMERKEGGGSLNSSCMNGDSEYLDIYENCKDLSILILKDKHGSLCGRALVWNVGELTLIDRIYVSDDYMFQMFFDYASKNNFIRKYEQSYSNKCKWVKPNGEVYEEYYKIITDTDFSQYPYIDTFSYGEDGYLTNSSSHTYEYNCTNGKRSGDEEEGRYIYDDIGGCDIDEDYAVLVQRGTYANMWTHEDNTVRIDGQRWWIQDEQIVCLYNGEYAHINDASFCEYNEEWYLSEDLVLIDKGEFQDKYLHHSLVVDIDGQNWWHNDDLIQSENGVYSIINID